MKTTTKLLIILLCYTTQGMAQQATIDSLNNLLNKKSYRNHKEQLQLMDKLCEQYVYNNLVEAGSIARTQLLLAKRYNETEYEAYALDWLGQMYYMQGKNDSAIYYFSIELNLREAKLSKDKNWELT